MLRLAVMIGIAIIAVGMAQAQPTPAGELNADELLILQTINENRRTNGVAYVIPNAVLNQIAETYVSDLASRPVGDRRDRFVLGDDTSVDTLLSGADFPAYSDGYLVDLVPILGQGYEPSRLVTLILEDARLGDGRQFRSRRMERVAGVNRLPLFEPIFREVGIAHQYQEGTDRHIYMLVFASRPGVLPVVVTVEPERSLIAITVSMRQVRLRVSNENSHTNGDVINEQAVIGLAKKMRISEQPGEEACPANPFETPPGWMDYVNNPEYVLSDGFGLKTIYVQMCDVQGRTLTSSVQVTYSGEEAGSGTPLSDDPRLLNIIYMTQTAAVEATAIAPLLPTVEAALTATAAAP